MLGIRRVIARFAALHNIDYGDVSTPCQGAVRKILHAYNQSVTQEPCPTPVRDCQDIGTQSRGSAKVPARQLHMFINNGLYWS